MMDWDKLRTFSAAVQAGSFSNAEGALNLSQSAISRQVSALERSLKTSLFHRHARGLKLTEQGEVLYDAVKDVIARVAMAEAALTAQRDLPRGPLKISTTIAFGAFWLAPHLNEFHDLYPDITLTLVLDGGTADLAMREADVAIRMSVPDSSSVIQRRILSSRSFAYAAPGYLKRYGVPTHGTHLDRHRLIVQDNDGHRDAHEDKWLLELGADGGKARTPIAALNNVYGLFRAVAGGLGIGALPHFIAPESAGLVRLLPDSASPQRDGYFVYPAELRHSKRIAVFRDFIIRKLAETQPRPAPVERSAASAAKPPRSRSPFGFAAHFDDAPIEARP
ncbi:MAG: LysR family transcriptional regulator [Aliidongia sp.]